MVNYQIIITKEEADSTPTPYGLRVAFTAPSGIEDIANGVPSGDKWATGGNLVGFLTNGKYVECSITYVSSISGGPSAGWYFWYFYSGDSSGTYQSISDPTGDDVAFTLKNVGGTWKAIFQNVTDSTSNTYTITNAPDVTLSITHTNRLMMESSNDDCNDYADFDEIDFTNFRYLQSNGSFTNQIPTTAASFVYSTLEDCIAIDESEDKIYHT